MSEKTESFRRSETHTFGLLLLIVVLGAFLRFYQIGKLSLWYDEIMTCTNVANNLLDTLKTGTNMSTFLTLAAIWIRIFPHASEGTLRALPAIISLLGIPVIFQLGRSMAENRRNANWIGLVSALLIAVNAFHIEFAQEFRSYSLVLLLTSFSTLFLIKIFDDPEKRVRWLLLYILASAGAVYSHFLAGFLLLAHGLVVPILLIGIKNPQNRVKTILLGLAGVIALIGPIAIVALKKGPGGIAWVIEPTPQYMLEYVSALSGGQSGWLRLIYLILVGTGLFLGTNSTGGSLLNRKWKYLLLVSCLIVPPAAGYLFSMRIVPIFIIKYFLYAMPYLVVLAACGLVELGIQGKDHNWASWVFAAASSGVLGLLILLSVTEVQSYYSTSQKDDWRGASQYLTANCQSALRLYYMPWMENSTVYYNSELFSQEKAWWLELIAEDPSTGRIAAALPKDFQQVCLVLGHTSIRERAAMVEKIQTAIRRAYPHVSRQPFFGVEVVIFKR